MGDLEQTIGYGQTTDDSGEHTFVGFSDIKDPETGSSSTSLGAHVDVSDTGVHVDAAGGNFNIQSEDGYGGNVGGFTANAEAVWDNDGYYGLGATANVLEGGANYGRPSGDATSADDVFVKGGLSEGAGAAGRVYMGTDVDHDGVEEFGLGADYLFAGADVRIESQTLTEVHAAASETYNEVASEASAAYDVVAEGASQAWDSVTNLFSSDAQ
jgi:hypothetical protein